MTIPKRCDNALIKWLCGASCPALPRKVLPSIASPSKSAAAGVGYVLSRLVSND